MASNNNFYFQSLMKNSDMTGRLNSESDDEFEQRQLLAQKPILKNKKIMYLWGIGIAMGAFTMGYSMVLITILTTSIQHRIKSSSTDKHTFYLSLCTTSISVGALVGSFAYIKVLKIIKTQKKALILSDSAIIFLYLLQLISLNPLLIIFLRFFLGVLVGISATIVPMYLKSISPIQISGQVGAFNQTLSTIGIAVGYAMGFIIDDQNLGNQWRWRVCVLVPCISCISRIFICKKFKYDMLERHISNQDTAVLQEYIGKFYEKNTFSIEDLIQSKKVKISAVNADLVSANKKINKRVILSIVLVLMNQFCGISAILFYANQLFSDLSKGDPHFAVLMSFYLGLFQLIFTILSGFLVDKYGRKFLMILGECVIICSLFATYLILVFGGDSGKNNTYVAITIFANIAGYSISIGPITFIYISEILSNISKFMVMLWIQIIAFSLFSNILIQSYGIAINFFVFGICSVACLVYVIANMIQTKGKDRKTIYSQFGE